ncbi:dihydrofolate reductase [Corynebacterium sp. SCR221107]|uniref:dihydrofolate reductase n=1 Tax=Corynebacterium sp. SCR221107 TaxID=3017361 RepID=UPI0022EC397F|nr:dihydrofolate reductase [Corynebacterium sp. SCR221107]WBT09539.1 dihydrofolate reductase [Corynebacterium sp. SCR221107]
MRAIWAQSRDGIIGDGTDMPWYLPEDLAHFKRTTVGEPVLMGRSTWESIPQRFRPLRDRENVVVSTRPAGQWSQGARVLAQLPDSFDGWVMGGGQVYAATLPHTDEVVVTLVDATLADALGDKAVYAPRLEGFQLREQTDWLVSDKGHLHEKYRAHGPMPLRYRFQWYHRV